MRVVDVDEVMEDICSSINAMTAVGIAVDADFLWGKLNDALENASTIDAVPVVRCEYCKYKQGSACDYSAVWVKPNGFCHWGKRKDDEDN